MARHLEFLDHLAAHGQSTLTARELREQLKLSPSAASNLLRRWLDAGLVDRVASGSYVIRPLGRLGTSAASEDIALAVGAVFRGRPHRIAYRSALEHHDLLLHPSRTIQVATPRRGRLETLSRRRLRQIYESAATVAVGSEPAGHGAMVSTIERSLLDAAARLDLIGGPSVLAEAIRASHPNPNRLQELGEELSVAAPLRRIGSIAERMGLDELVSALEPIGQGHDYIPLDPREADRDAFRDDAWRVKWPDQPAALIS